jgi:hypothetical protein
MQQAAGAAAPLGAEEQRLSTELGQLIAHTLQQAHTLSSFDVTAPAATVRAMEKQLQQHLSRIRSLLADLQYAAEEQET